MAALDVIELTRRLVACPSISSADPRLDQSNQAVIDCLAEACADRGFHIDIQSVVPGKFNLIAVLGDASDRDGLILSGHTDTVPYDAQQWQSDPFQLNERDQRLYGLGVTDMKAFFALALAAVQQVDRRRLQRPLVLLATADEESSMSGVKAVLARGERPGRYAVIGEPTILKPVRMHKGVLAEALCVHGHAGHASQPALGANAIDGMHRVLSAVMAWRDELQARHHNAGFNPPTPTVNFGAIHGGDNSNRICAYCETLLDVRLLPGMQADSVRTELRQRLANVLAAEPRLRLDFRAVFEGLPPFETAADAPLVQACEALSGVIADSAPFGTEAPYLSALGMETVVLGPGNIAQAHQPDEYLALNQIQPGIDLYRGLIERFCT